MCDGSEPITDDEILYRRIPGNPDYFDQAVCRCPSPRAFSPTPRDSTGVSLYRAKYKSPREVARNPRGKLYYVAAVSAGDLRKQGIEVVPRPNPEEGPGHAEISNLTYANRKTQESREHCTRLALVLTLRVEGPFPGDEQG